MKTNFNFVMSALFFVFFLLNTSISHAQTDTYEEPDTLDLEFEKALNQLIGFAKTMMDTALAKNTGADIENSTIFSTNKDGKVTKVIYLTLMNWENITLRKQNNTDLDPYFGEWALFINFNDTSWFSISLYDTTEIEGWDNNGESITYPDIKKIIQKGLFFLPEL